ncbi:MAG: domain S-box protein [Bacteroidetes bacterium]|jgi:two-component system CheB/CheR fusion protein|nr:domain S-box protein [Bacteroidota bacterium]
MKAETKKKAGKSAIKPKPFYIVAIGASAGGLEAVKSLLQELQPDAGMAFIYIQHLSPHHPSTLTSLLARSTKMKVVEVTDNVTIQPNHFYVCTPDKEMNVSGGKIKLQQRDDSVLPYLPIDSFFTSLARTNGNRVIGIILSGNARDGTQGLKAIKEANGITIAQDSSAKNKSMPESAIQEKVVDYILSPAEIAVKLSNMHKPSASKPAIDIKKKTEMPDLENENLSTVIDLVYNATGVDFSNYKSTTIKRRLHHRMTLHKIKTIKEYIKLLKNKKEHEAIELYNDFLINVTSFFRDPDVYRYLKAVFFPKLIQSKAPNDALRIWIPACSSGEEAYSMAMIILELKDELNIKIPVQIFATDVSVEAIKDARIGEYNAAELKAMSQKRIDRFFVKTKGLYRVSKQLREICVFAPHNILRDPPFSRIDFISCRNLLIYFDAKAQKKAITTIHFALNPGGSLLLGKSETVGTAFPFFSQINSKYNIYSLGKNNHGRKLPELDPPLQRRLSPEHSARLFQPDKKKPAETGSELDNAINTLLLSHYMPACAVINKNMEILQFRGSTSLFLSHQPGKASLNILKMIQPEFAFELRGAIHTVIKTKKTVKKTDIELKISSNIVLVSLEVMPLVVDNNETLLLVVFNQLESKKELNEIEKGNSNNSSKKDKRIQKLTQELNNVRAEMHTMIELQETANEQLQAANEEIVSSNEEFQTLNEELETSKEEIEASNEELISTNQELQMRNELLTESYNYSEAIIETIHEPMIVLDENLHVKSASKSFYKKFHASKDETEGVLLSKLGNKQWDIPQLNALLKDVITNNTDFDNFEMTHQFKGIGEKTMLLNAHRIVQKNHKEKLTLLAIKDITERSQQYQKEKDLLHKDIRLHKADKEELEKAVKKRTRLIEQKNKELEDANKDLTSFTYVSSHDLQEPLRKIQNFVTCIVLEEENLSPAGKDYFLRLQKTAKRMQFLIEDLLAYSRTKSSDRKFEYTKLNVLMNEVIGDFDEILKTKKGTITVGRLSSANVIPFQFRQLMHNLISNSLKFSKPRIKPKIEVKSRLIPAGKPVIENMSFKKDYLNIIFTDNGIGFDPQYKDRIFQVFQRLHSFEEYNGTGIGLAICKRIVENHHGIITAKGQLNKGARFDIYIPIEQ